MLLFILHATLSPYDWKTDPTVLAWIAIYVAILTLLIGLVTTIVVYLKQRNRKELSFGVISATPLLSIRPEAKGIVQVLYNSKPVSNVRLVILKIWNSGNQEVKLDDYVKNQGIKFDCGSSSEILDVQITEKIPPNLDVTLTKSSESFLLDPFLLNKRESLTIQVLISSDNDSIVVDARINGTEQIAISRETTIAYSAIEESINLIPLVEPLNMLRPIAKFIFDIYLKEYLHQKLRKKKYASNIKVPLSLDIQVTD